MIMSRQEDFNTQSDKYVEGRKSFGVNDPYALKEIGEAHYQGAEHGYQYAIEKACQYLYDWNKKQAEKHGSKAVLGIREFTISVSDFRKAMED